MIVTKNGLSGLRPGERSFATEAYDFYWAGFAYLPRVAPGEASLAVLAKSLDGQNLQTAVEALRGNFFLVIHDRRGNQWHAFLDPGGMWEAFWTPTAIGTSFLDMASRTGCGSDQLSPEAVVEFLNLGHLYEDRTLVPGIRRCEPEAAYVLGNEGTVRCVPRQVRSILERPAAVTMESFFDDLCESLAGRVVSVDLTGGFDSRLVASLLSARGLPFEVALAAVPECVDVEIAREVAQALGRTLYVAHPQMSPLADEVDALYDLSDARCDLLTAHRLRQAQAARRSRGMDLAISGVGGELYKDFWWYQDFPFYHRRRANVQRLRDMRFAPPRVEDDFLGPRCRSANGDFESQLMKTLNRRLADTNTASYDRIYYEVKMRTVAARVLTMQSGIIDAYAPLLDTDLVRIGLHLPRWLRAGSGYHRRLITRISPEVAAIRTSLGVSASARWRHRAADLVVYAGKTLNLFRRMLRPAAARRYRTMNPDHPDLLNQARRLPAMSDALKTLQDADILNESLTIDRIPAARLGRVLTLGLFVSRLS